MGTIDPHSELATLRPVLAGSGLSPWRAMCMGATTSVLLPVYKLVHHLLTFSFSMARYALSGRMAAVDCFIPQGGGKT